MKEVEDITAGAVTSGKRCPDPFAPATPRFAASSLRNQAIDHHESNCLFRNVVGGFDIGGRDEFKVGLSPFEESFGHIPGFFRRWNMLRCLCHHDVTCCGEPTRERCRFQFVTTMNHFEHHTDRIAKTLSIILCSPVRQGHKELHVANQMGNAKLNSHDSHQ